MTSPTFPAIYSLKSNNVLSQNVGVLVGLVISGALDTTKLEAAYQELVRLWPAVGGTLIKSTSPYSFSTSYLVNFGSRNMPQNLEDIPSLSFISKASTTYPTCHVGAEEIDHLFHYDSLKDMPPHDTLLALRVTVLKDATLLGFRFSHHLFDGQACYDTLKAYCDLLSGKTIPELIPPPDITEFLSDQVQGDEDLPPNVDSYHPHLHPSSNYSSGLGAPAKYIGSTLFAKLKAKIGLGDSDNERMVHVPGDFVERLRKHCQNYVDDASRRGILAEGSGLQLTKNDVLTAWFLKNAYAHFTRSDTEGIDAQICFNFRPHLEPLPENQFYLHNSFYHIRTHFPSNTHLQNSSLGEIALSIRLTCLRNRQPSAVKECLQFWEKNVKTFFVFPSPPDRPLSIYNTAFFSHWTTFDFAKLYFSGAMVVADNGRGSSGCSVIYTHPGHSIPLKLTLKPTVTILKDGSGGYWIRAHLYETGWKGIEESTYII